MLKLLITVFIYGCLALNCNCYANINSERDSISREREVNDLYDGDINQVDDKRNYETPNDESWPRESDEDDDVYDDFQRDAEVAENEDDDEPTTHFSYKKELMDAIYHGKRADQGMGYDLFLDLNCGISF